RPDAGRLAPAGARRAAGDPSSKHGAEDGAAATAQVTSPHDSRAGRGAARDRNDIVVPQSGVNRARPAPGPAACAPVTGGRVAPGFERDIRPFFRDKGRTRSMMKVSGL